MSTYIIFSMGEPKYKVEAYFYDVDKHFMSFYDEDDNLIGSINVDEIDFVVDKEHMNKLYFLEPVNKEDYGGCDKIKCECHTSKFEEPTENESKYSATRTLKPTEKQKSEVDFDELFKRVLGLHGKK